MSPARRALLEVAAALLILGGVFVSGLLVGAKHQDTKAGTAQAQADQLKGEAKGQAQLAHQADQQAMKDQATVTDADALARAAKRELDRRLAALHGGAPASHPDHIIHPDEMVSPLPAIPDSGGLKLKSPERGSNLQSSNLQSSDELTLTRAALAQALEVNADREAQLAARDRLIASLTASRDYWKATAEDREKALALQEIASQARASAQAKQTLWGEIKTGLASAALGYATGRAR